MAEKNWDCLRLFHPYKGSYFGTLLKASFAPILQSLPKKIELTEESLHELHEVFPDFSWKSRIFLTNHDSSPLRIGL